MSRKAFIRPDEPGREKILEAGLELFGQKGFEATSIAEIGDRAGITKSVMYHYFGSKSGLYEAILRQQTDDLVRAVAEVVPDDDRAPRFREGIDAYLAFFEARPESWGLLLSEAPVDPQLAKLHAELALQRSEGLADLLASEAKRKNSERHISLVIAGIRAFTAWWREHKDVPRERVVDAIVQFASAGARLP